MDHRFFVNFKIDDGIGDAVEVKKENVSKAEVEGLARAAGLVYHRRTTCGAYHQGRRAALVSHHAPACIFLRLDGYTKLRIDDIPQRVADDIHAFGVIETRIESNLLHFTPKYDIMLSKGVIL